MTGSIEAAAPGSPYFALHTLGWRAFQDLCAAVLRQVWGQSIQAFADSNDAGRDGAFYGSWSSIQVQGFDAIPDGPFVLQCKHSKSADATLSKSTIGDEFEKVKGLVERGLCETYILLTNARVTGSAEEKIRARLIEEGVKYPLILSGQWICDTIAANRELRMFVPRVYGLGDLSQILDERSYAQAARVLAVASEEVSSFVVTAAYRKAAESLRDYGFVLLLGEPGVGKSAIALMLALSAADNWACLLIKPRTPNELIERWNPHEQGQLFWIDDAFGAVRHEERLTSDWSRSLPHVMSAIKGGARVVVTSRSYIYNDARPLLKTYAFPLLNEGLVTVDVADISQSERQHMLYNHVSAGDQPAEVIKLMKPHLEAAADAEAFRPETARRLGLQAFTSGLTLNREGVVSFMARPQQFLSDVYGQLQTSAQAALALVYSTGTPGLATSLAIKRAERVIVEACGSTPADATKAFALLVGTFLKRDTHRYHFKHPTLREGFANWLTDQHHVVAAILKGMDDNAVLDSTDCLISDSEPIRGTLMRIPPSLYGAVSRRMYALFEEWPDGSCWTGSACRYMARRGSDAMLKTYMSIDPELPARLLDFGPFASFVPEPVILSRLHQLELLPDVDRRAALRHMAKLAVDYLDWAWLEEGPWQILLKPNERTIFMEYVRKMLIPKLDVFVTEDWIARVAWKSEEDSNDANIADPVGHSLRLHRRVFEEAGDSVAVEAFTRALSIHHSHQASNRSEVPTTRDARRSDSNRDNLSTCSSRSVFADIDDMQ